jgi:hypothetical protein
VRRAKTYAVTDFIFDVWIIVIILLSPLFFSRSFLSN